MNLERRILATARRVGVGPRLENQWNREYRDAEAPSTIIKERRRLKGHAWFAMIFTAVGISITSVFLCGANEMSAEFTVMVTTIATISTVLLGWVVSWPFPSRNQDWRDAVNFVTAIHYAEDVMDQPYEHWDDLDEVTAKVTHALTLEINGINKALEDPKTKERPHILFVEWENRRSLMRRLLPGVPEYTSFPVSVWATA